MLYLVENDYFCSTNNYKMKRSYYITIFAVLVILYLQIVYIFREYNNYVDENMLKSQESITKAISDELYIRSYRPHQKAVSDMPPAELDSLKRNNRQHIRNFKPINMEDARKRGMSIGKLVDLYFQDAEMNRGDILRMKLLQPSFDKYNTNRFKYRIIRYNAHKEPIDSVGERDLPSYRTSKFYPIGSNGMLYVRFKIHIGMSDFLVHQLWITGLTGLLILLVVLCLFLQLREIRLKDEVIKKRTQNVNGTIHDLKSPLNSVIALLEWLKKDDISEAKKQAIQLSLNGVRHTVCNIEALLMTARSDRRKLVLRKEAIEVPCLVEGVKNELDMLYTAKPHTILIENHLPAAFRLEVDGMYIENVFRNLIENALKYSGDGVKINVILQKKYDIFQAEIRDNGWGIPAKYRKRLFEAFFQVPRDKAHSTKGYGIGLAQVQAIIQAHGGEIHVQSIENEGSCFTFTLPIYQTL